jgi:hypothetical protein
MHGTVKVRFVCSLRSLPFYFSSHHLPSFCAGLEVGCRPDGESRGEPPFVLSHFSVNLPLCHACEVGDGSRASRCTACRLAAHRKVYSGEEPIGLWSEGASSSQSTTLSKPRRILLTVVSPLTVLKKTLNLSRPTFALPPPPAGIYSSSARWTSEMLENFEGRRRRQGEEMERKRRLTRLWAFNGCVLPSLSFFPSRIFPVPPSYLPLNSPTPTQRSLSALNVSSPPRPTALAPPILVRCKESSNAGAVFPSRFRFLSPGLHLLSRCNSRHTSAVIATLSRFPLLGNEERAVESRFHLLPSSFLRKFLLKVRDGHQLLLLLYRHPLVLYVRRSTSSTSFSPLSFSFLSFSISLFILTLPCCPVNRPTTFSQPRNSPSNSPLLSPTLPSPTSPPPNPSLFLPLLFSRHSFFTQLHRRAHERCLPLLYPSARRTFSPLCTTSSTRSHRDNTLGILSSRTVSRPSSHSFDMADTSPTPVAKIAYGTSKPTSEQDEELEALFRQHELTLVAKGAVVRTGDALAFPPETLNGVKAYKSSVRLLLPFSPFQMLR